MYEIPADEYRFDVVQHAPGSEPTIYRARPCKTFNSDDAWEFYWEGSEMCAVYDDDGYSSPTKGSNPEWTARAEQVMIECARYDQDVDDALTRLAVRLFDHDAPNARFIPVGIDRGVTLYCLSWDGDPDRTWANEIEAVSYGDVWRFEVEEYNTFTESWEPSDSCDEFYGEVNAMERWYEEYPLDAFPAHLVISEQVGA